ncbi:UNVERIFIED_ORG: hypothetical protein J2Y93_002424 [Pantoea agglomerans]
MFTSTRATVQRDNNLPLNGKTGSIVGFKIGNAMVEQLDVMAAAKAQ